MEKIVYILEDDESICELVKCTLDMNGIHSEYFVTVKDFYVALEKKQPSVLLLDIMLGDGNGVSVLEDVKKRYPEVSCIILSALGKETDKVKCLNLGADDYITKPFGVLELTARVNVALRRFQQKDSVIRKGDLLLNEEVMSVTLKGESIELNRKEFKLLKYFMENEGKVLSRDELLQNIWGFDDGETRTLDNHIARLRKTGITYIETVFGIGYKFKVNN